MKYIYSILIWLIGISACKQTPTISTDKSTTHLAKSLDSIVKPFIDSVRAAGIAVAVYHGTNPVLLKSYGYADLEFKTPLPVDASFEIGSVTKQFTAAAILQLVDSGKINLEDDLTKYIPFNTQGHTVTIRHLLSHTSGIQGYTEMPNFGSLSIQKYPRDTLLRIVEKEKFDFKPGEALIYNNTGFFMLGLIIEKVTGISYESYIQHNLFGKAGMSHSYYCNERKVITNRAHGYDTEQEGLVRAAYLDHTWPYAAGSLCSTTEDLVKWNNALHHGRILSEKMYSEFLNPTILSDGSATHYAKGITVTEDHSKTMIEHGGGINGFLSENRYYPKEDLSIVVLVNSTGPVSPTSIANQIADDLWGKPISDTTNFNGDLSAYTGKFTGRGRGQDISITITTQSDSLMAMQGEPGQNQPFQLQFKNEDTWKEGNASYHFKRDGGEIVGLQLDQVYGYYVLKRN